MSAPLVVNTTDGTVWTRREAVRDGLALYAPEKCGGCPEFVMATYAELEGHGVTGSADVLPVPVPVGPEPLSAERLAEIEARAEAATAGPWWTDTLAEHDGSESVGIDAEGDVWIVPCQDIDQADAEFMAHARSDVPELVAEVRRQAAEVASLNDSLTAAADRMRADAARIAELEKREAAVAEFAAKRAEYITAIRNCHPDNGHDYDRWQGHAAARRQLSELLGLPVAWPLEGGVPAPRLAHVQREPEGEHYAQAHHDYRVPRDLPETGGV